MVKYVYDAWGNHEVKVLDSNCTELSQLNPFRYRGYYYDTETKLYYLKTRYYDPETGRFITIDDLSYLDPEHINGLNLYAYCGNNPVMCIDPDGTKWSWKKFWKAVGLAITAVAAIVVSVATFGAATPLAMTIVAAVTLTAGILTGINAIATFVEAGTGYNFVRDGIFQGNEKAYNIYSGVVEAVAIVGTLVLGVYQATPSGQKTMADNKMARIMKNPEKIQKYDLSKFQNIANKSSWQTEKLGRGRHIGEGFRAFKGDALIQWHPGSVRHFKGAAYWKICSGVLGRLRFLYLF